MRAGTLLDDLLPFDFGYSLGVPVPPQLNSIKQ